MNYSALPEEESSLTKWPVLCQLTAAAGSSSVLLGSKFKVTQVGNDKIYFFPSQADPSYAQSL